MRKLTDIEQRILNTLVRRGSICLGDASQSALGHEITTGLRGLMRKKRVYVEETDDGPAFYPTQAGRNDAQA